MFRNWDTRGAEPGPPSAWGLATLELRLRSGRKGCQGDRCSLTQHGPWALSEMAPHSCTFAWKIPWTGEPNRPRSMGSPRVGHG